jgi:plastocyanin
MRVRRVLACLVVPLTACSQASTSASTEAGRAVLVQHIAFQPSTIEVPAGTTITWMNRDEQVRHTVTSGRAGDKGIPGVDEGRPNDPDGMFAGELDGAGSTFKTTFDDAGTYAYFCEVHPVMTGSIVVT